MPRLLVDEFVAQHEQCRAAGCLPDELDHCADVDEDGFVLIAWGADPFDIIAALEEEHGCPITRM